MPRIPAKNCRMFKNEKYAQTTNQRKEQKPFYDPCGLQGGAEVKYSSKGVTSNWFRKSYTGLRGDSKERKF